MALENEHHITCRIAFNVFISSLRGRPAVRMKAL